MKFSLRSKAPLPVVAAAQLTPSATPEPQAGPTPEQIAVETPTQRRSKHRLRHARSDAPQLRVGEDSWQISDAALFLHDE